MANELRAVTVTGKTIYCHILNSAGQRWNGTAFENYSSGNYASYDVALSEDGSSGVYLGDFPTAISDGIFEGINYLQSGGSPAQGDRIVGTQKVNWTGGAAVSESSAGGMSGSAFRNYVIETFIRPDKDTELFTSISDIVREVRRRFDFVEDETEKTLTDIISVLGDYRMNVESDFGLLLADIVLEDGDTSYPLNKLSKEQFDRKYPNPGSSTVTKSPPIDYMLFGGIFYIGPVPDKTSYLYRISYASEAGGLINSSTVSVPYTDIYRYMMKAGTLWHLFESVELYERAAYWEQKFEKTFKSVALKEDFNRSAVMNVGYNDF